MTENINLFCISANFKKVVFDPLNSHTAMHFGDTPSLKKLVCDLLSSTILHGEIITKDFEMGKIVGKSNVVVTDNNDEIIYAMRKGRGDQGYVPFTKSKPAQPSSLISIYLIKKDPQTYELASTWIGSYESPMFPQMKNATEGSIPYWSKHAFVWGTQDIIPGTELYECPW